MLAICKREIKAYLYSVTGWLFMAVILCLVGYYFFIVNLNYGYANLASSLSSVFIILILTTPILAMRILAEERKQKTDQMILTAPVSVAGIVIGKYLAMAVIFTIPILIICTMPLILTQFGTVAMGESYTGILCFYLLGLACLAVSMLISSLTESQVIAAVLSFVVLFIGYMMDSIYSFIFTQENVITKILSLYSFYPRLIGLMGGTLDVKAVLYFVSLIAVCLFLTTQSIQKRRYQVSVKNLQMGAYSTGMTAIVVAIAVILNMGAALLPDSYTVLDVSSQKLYSLSDTTKELVGGLTEDVTIYAVVEEESMDGTLAQTLERYLDLSEHLKLVYINPITNPNFYKEYADSITLNSLIVESDRRFKVIDYNDMYEYTFDYNTYSSTVTGYDAEGQLTSAIAYVTSESAPKMYVVDGHGEVTLSDSFSGGLKKQNTDYEALTLLTSDAVPEDADALIINAPTEDINPEDAQKLIEYLDNGGKLLVSTAFTEKFAETMPNLTSVLAYFNVAVGDGILVEEDRNYMYQSAVYLMPQVMNDTLTDGVYADSYDVVMMPYTQAIDVTENEDVTVTTLLSTSASSFEKVDMAEGDVLEKAEEDRTGSFPVGIHAVKTSGDKQAELILYSCGFIFTDQANQYTMDNNLRLFTNAVSAFAGEGESISVPVKSYSADYLTVSVASALTYGAVYAILIPVGFLLYGIIVWYRRRKR